MKGLAVSRRCPHLRLTMATKNRNRIVQSHRDADSIGRHTPYDTLLVTETMNSRRAARAAYDLRSSLQIRSGRNGFRRDVRKRTHLPSNHLHFGICLYLSHEPHNSSPRSVSPRARLFRSMNSFPAVASPMPSPLLSPTPLATTDFSRALDYRSRDLLTAH
jgi:hypothetical protein